MASNCKARCSSGFKIRWSIKIIFCRIKFKKISKIFSALVATEKNVCFTVYSTKILKYYCLVSLKCNYGHVVTFKLKYVLNVILIINNFNQLKFMSVIIVIVCMVACINTCIIIN